MRYVDKHGFIGKLYYEFVIVDLWTKTEDEGRTVPLFSINLLQPNNGGFAVIFKPPYTSIGFGVCK